MPDLCRSGAAGARAWRPVIECYGGDRPWTTVERSDDYDGTTGPTPETGDEPEGWPW